MSRIFAYCRVSTLDQATENQHREIGSASFKIKPQQIVGKHISGPAATSKRPGLSRLLVRLKRDGRLIVTKLGRLDCNAMGIRKTVEQLTRTGIRVHCLALGSIDLTSSTGEVVIQVISAVAEFERGLLLKRTRFGIIRARDVGKRFSRPPVLNEKQKQVVFERVKSGASIGATAREFKTSRQATLRTRVKPQTPDM